MYETESVITMVLGLWMVNVVFSFGHRLLNFQSARVTYFVNASAIYLSGSPPVNAVFRRIHYTAHHLQLAWFSLWPDIRSRDCDNSV